MLESRVASMVGSMAGSMVESMNESRGRVEGESRGEAEDTGIGSGEGDTRTSEDAGPYLARTGFVSSWGDAATGSLSTPYSVICTPSA